MGKGEKQKQLSRLSSNNTMWYCIETEKEFCIVDEKSVMFDEKPEVGDKVQFFYGSNLQLTGTIRLITHDESSCTAEANRLRKAARTALQSSFHSDQPRKAAMKYKDTLKRKVDTASQNIKGSGKKSKNKESDELVEKMEKATCSKLLRKEEVKKNKEEPIYSESETDDDNKTVKESDEESVKSNVGFNDSDAEEELESKKLAAALAAKYDVKQLKQLVADNFVPSGNDTKKPPVSRPAFSSFTFNSSLSSGPFIGPSTSGGKMQATSELNNSKKDGSKHDKIKKTHTSQSCNKTDAGRRHITVPRHQVHGVSNVFRGPMYAVENPDDGIEVYEKTGIYCLEDNYTKADGASSATMVARRLLEGVFTREALIGCSVSGLPPRGRGKDSYKDASAIKPFLCPKAVNAIVCLALNWQKSKHFLKRKDDSQIRQAIAVRLNELQPKRPLPSDKSNVGGANGQEDDDTGDESEGRDFNSSSGGLFNDQN